VRSPSKTGGKSLRVALARTRLEQAGDLLRGRRPDSERLLGGVVGAAESRGRRHSAERNQSTDTVWVLRRVHRRDRADVGKAHERHALESEVASHRLDVGEVVRDADPRGVAHRVRAAATAQIVENQALAVGERPERTREVDGKGNDDRLGTAAAELVMEAQALFGR